jgi:hypothetical protein
VEGRLALRRMTLCSGRARSRSTAVVQPKGSLMFYVVLLIIAAVLVAGLYFVRGRSSRA